MSLLNGTRAYLAGPVERCIDSGMPWRQSITDRLIDLGVVVWDPLIKSNWHIDECRGELSAETQRSDVINMLNGQLISKNSTPYYRNKLTREVCLRLVCAADFVICYVDGPTVGTFEELYLAKSQNKPILFILRDNQLDSCWRAAQFPDATYFRSTTSLIDYLKDISLGSAHVDKKQWIFLPGVWPNACETTIRSNQ